MKNYIKYIILGGIVCFIILIYLIITNEDSQLIEVEQITTKITSISTNITSNKIFIDVKGAVKKPGVYSLNNGDRVIDAINAAGGLSKNGVTTNLNLSKIVTNEMVVYVFTKSELQKTTSVYKNEVPCICETIEVKNCVTEDEKNSAITNENLKDDKEDIKSNEDNFVTTTKLKDDFKSINKVNINKATIEELMNLNGIGESKAKAIIDYRTNNGSFNNIEDIMKVSGIGESVFIKIKDSITV